MSAQLERKSWNQTNFKAKMLWKKILPHVLPLSIVINPGKQEHVKEPSVLVHVSEQPPLLLLHSSTSEKINTWLFIFKPNREGFKIPAAQQTKKLGFEW